MAYVEQYYSNWRDSKGKEHEVKLLLEGGSSGIIGIPAVQGIAWTDDIKGGKQFQIKNQIAGNGILFNFVVEEVDISDYDDIFESQYKDWKIEKYFDSSLEWVGWLQPDNFRRPLVAKGGKYYISLSAVDGLANLKKIEFVNASDGSQYEDRVTIMTTIKRALEHVGFELDFRVQLATWCSNDSLMLSTDCALDKATCDSRRFRKTKEGRFVNTNCYQVISELLKPFNCHLIQSQGEYWIVNPRDYFVDTFKILWSDLTIDSTSLIDSRTDITAAETDTMRTIGEVQRIAPLEQINVSFRDRNIGDSLLSNGDFAIGNTDEWVNRAGADWGVFSLVAHGDDNELYCLHRDTVDGTPTEPISFYSVAQHVVPRGDADILSVLFKVRCTQITMDPGFSGSSWQESVQLVCQLRKGSPTGVVISSISYPFLPLKRTDTAYTIYQSDFNISVEDDYYIEFITDKVAINWSDYDFINLRFDEFSIITQYSTGDDITFDKHYKITNTDSSFIGVEKIELNFGDSVSDSDIASFQIGGIRTETWNRWLKNEDISINILAGQNIIENYSKYKNYRRLVLFDDWEANPRLFPHRLIVISGVTYQIVSWKVIYKILMPKTIEVDLVELLSDVVTTSVLEEGLNTVDGVSNPGSIFVNNPIPQGPPGVSDHGGLTGREEPNAHVRYEPHDNKIWYVNLNDGLDTNTGLSVNLPLLTLQKAIDLRDADAVDHGVIYILTSGVILGIVFSLSTKETTIIGAGELGAVNITATVTDRTILNVINCTFNMTVIQTGTNICRIELYQCSSSFTVDSVINDPTKVTLILDKSTSLSVLRSFNGLIAMKYNSYIQIQDIFGAITIYKLTTEHGAEIEIINGTHTFTTFQLYRSMLIVASGLTLNIVTFTDKLGIFQIEGATLNVTGSRTTIPGQFANEFEKIHDYKIWYVDGDNGSAANPGTFGEPFDYVQDAYDARISDGYSGIGRIEILKSGTYSGITATITTLATEIISRVQGVNLGGLTMTDIQGGLYVTNILSVGTFQINQTSTNLCFVVFKDCNSNGGLNISGTVNDPTLTFVLAVGETDLGLAFGFPDVSIDISNGASFTTATAGTLSALSMNKGYIKWGANSGMIYGLVATVNGVVRCVDTTGVTITGTFTHEGTIFVKKNKITVSGTETYTPGEFANIRDVEVTLNQSQIQNLNNTPIDLVAVLGSGIFAEILSVSAKNVFNTAAFATAQILQIIYAGGSSIWNTSSSFIQSGSDRYEKLAQTAPAQSPANTKIQITSDADATLGNAASEIKVYIRYKIIDTN